MATNVVFPARRDPVPGDSSPLSEGISRHEAHSSGVSWPAVFGGAFVAASTSLMLISLGAGMGLSAVSPWSNRGISASTFGTAAIIWMLFTGIVASALGGWLTGRLRTKWAVIHTDEVYFRDTANGFLAWAVALVMGIVFLATAASSMAGGTMHLAATSDGAASADPNAYYVDTLFRSDRLAESRDTFSQAEAGRTLANALRDDQTSAGDQQYLARLVASRTGLSAPEAERRVTDVMARARADADAVRKMTARVLLWSFLALLMGAFAASWAATIGGRQRDHVVHTV